MKIAIIAPRSINGEKSEVEGLCDGLIKALNGAGHDATQIAVHVDKTSFQGLLEAYCEFFYLDLNWYDMVISTEAPSYMVRHKNHISYLFDIINPFYENLNPQQDSSAGEYQRQKEIIYAFDKYGLNPDRIKKHLAVSEDLVHKLRSIDAFWKWVHFEVIHVNNHADSNAAEKEGPHVHSLSWEDITKKILDPPQGTQNQHQGSSMLKKILVTDNQVLDPPIGGGRVRILELYKHFDPSLFEITYLGTFDWLGPDKREQKLASHFTEILVPMTIPHIIIDIIFSKLSRGTTTLDVTTPILMKFTPRYQKKLSQLIKDSDIVIVTHPWVYPYVKKELEKLEERRILIYDSQNLEYKIKRQLLNNTLMGKYLVNKVKGIEGLLIRDCDLLFACSQEDANGFIDQYGINKEQILIIPNGASVRDISVPQIEEKNSIRRHLGFERPIAVFLASGGYRPNDEAAIYICNKLAHSVEVVDFVIIGSVCDVITKSYGAIIPSNVKLMGIVNSEDKRRLLYASDIALNPVTRGSGTNIKVFDYLASGLPLITTPIGARGIDFVDQEDMIIADLDQFPEKIRRIISDDALKNNMSIKARALAERYDWSRIAKAAEKGILAMEN